MRLLSLLVVTLMVLAVTATAQVRRNVTIRLDGVDRHFIVALPSSQPPSGGYPLVFMFHGSGGDGEKFYNVSGWKETGERENFVSVFPSSFEY